MQGQWFYGVAANRLGPVPAAELQRLAQIGMITPVTLVWSEGMPQWVMAGTLPFVYPGGMPPGMAAAMRPDDGGALNLLMPIGPQSGLAIAAGYLGLLGFVFAIPAPIAVVLGILALRDIAKHPEKRGKGRAITGILLGSLVMVILTSLVVMGAMSHH